MEKKQHNSVFQIFILKNKLRKTEIAQYLGVSNAFITQLAQGLRSVPNEKIALIKANKQWDTSMFMDEGEMLTTDPIPQPESKPKQLEFDFNKWMQIEEVKANSFKEVTEANKLMAESNKILAQHTTEVIKEIKDTLVRLEQQIAKNGVDVQQGDNVISAVASGFNSEK